MKLLRNIFLTEENIHNNTVSSQYYVYIIIISNSLRLHIRIMSLRKLCLYIFNIAFCTYRFTIIKSVLVTKISDLQELADSESRVVLLYCTREEALRILQSARSLGITGENYVWVVTQSVMENLQAPQLFPVGMLGE